MRVVVNEIKRLKGPRRRSLPGLIYLIAICCLLMAVELPVSRAEEGTSWMPPILLSQGILSESGGLLNLTSPVMVSDVSGGVHVFWSADTGDGYLGRRDTLFYSNWDGISWSAPVDVFYTPGFSIWLPQVAADFQGWLHIVWVDNTVGNIWYSRVPIIQAGLAHAWAPPRIVAGPIASGVSLGVDTNGTVHLVHCSGMEDVVDSARYLSSNDGQTWSPPVDIGPIEASPGGNCRTRQAVDARGRLHVAWGLDWTTGTPVYYSRFDDSLSGWLAPLEVDHKDERYSELYGPGYISVETIGQDEVHLVWLGAPSGHRWHQWSSDGGNTWSPASQMFRDFRLFTEPSSMAVDSLGTLHLVSRGRREGHASGTYYSYWRDGNWSSLMLLYGDAGGGTRGGEFAAISVAEGNKLYVVWDDRDFSEIWTSKLETSAPVVPPRLWSDVPTEAVDQVENSGSVVATPVERQAPRASAASTSVLLPQHPSEGQEWWVQTSLVGILPAIVLSGLVLVVQWMRRRK